MDLHARAQRLRDDDYLFAPREAWFAFAMTLALMVFDYVDRQIIVSLFPFIKAEWGLSDAQLGSLVSVVSLTVALGALPVALIADRTSRVKSIVVMATIWSLATISCMWTRGYGSLVAARAAVGLGEAGYGSVGAALIASHFPARLRGALLAGFLASASVGSVLGVTLGGYIASHWGWRAAFGVVGLPGLAVALLYLKVRDYRTVRLESDLQATRRPLGQAATGIVQLLVRARTMPWVCIGGAAQLIVVSALWSWMPSFLNRVHGVAPAQAGAKAALVVLAGAAGSVIWGALVDRAGARRPRRKLAALVLLCLTSLAVLAYAFGAAHEPAAQFAWIVLGGFLATCSVGPVAVIVLDVIHPGVRATGAAVLTLFQNLFGLAVGPVLVGLMSDRIGLPSALAAVPLASLIAAAAFMLAARSYESDRARAASAADESAPTAAADP